MPVESLNHKTNLTESCCDGGVMSHGSSAFLSTAAHITRAGTVRGLAREIFIIYKQTHYLHNIYT